MYSKHHAIVSLVVAAVLVAVLPSVTVADYTVPAAVLVAYGTATGVLIDLDHFVIARYRTGRWDAVRFCLRNPAAAVADQGRIFARGDVGVLSRLLSHLLITGVLVPLLVVASAPLAILTAVVLYVHVITDVAWDVHRLGQQIDASTSEGELIRMLR